MSSILIKKFKSFLDICYGINSVIGISCRVNSVVGIGCEINFIINMPLKVGIYFGVNSVINICFGVNFFLRSQAGLSFLSLSFIKILFWRCFDRHVWGKFLQPLLLRKRLLYHNLIVCLDLFLVIR